MLFHRPAKPLSKLTDIIEVTPWNMRVYDFIYELSSTRKRTSEGIVLRLNFVVAANSTQSNNQELVASVFGFLFQSRTATVFSHTLALISESRYR